MICISILCFGHITNKFNGILLILKEVIIFPEKGDSFCTGKTYEYPTIKTRIFSFVEFIYEGKKLAAYGYAEEIQTCSDCWPVFYLSCPNGHWPVANVPI